MVSHDEMVLIEVFGEGATDIGRDSKRKLQSPHSGVVPILIHKLCGKPRQMRVKRDTIPQLQKKGLSRKVAYVKIQAYHNGSDAVVYVIDSEGGHKELETKRVDMAKGRDSNHADFPMVVGVAQPCIESWLLTDATALRRALDLSASPKIPENPENLSAPRENKKDNPKTALVKAAGEKTNELSVKQKESIARAINDLALLRQKCHAGFSPFADEIESRIKPLFCGTT